MATWEDQEVRGAAHLWRRPNGIGAFRYVVTDDHSNTLPDLGPDLGYDDAKTAWAAYEERKGIAREIDLNEM